MHKFFVASVFVLAFSAKSFATVNTTGAFGNWNTLEGVADDGNEVCELSTSWVDHRGAVVKFFNQSKYVEVIVLKDGWSIPKTAKVSMALSFGDYSPWLLQGRGDNNFVAAELPTSTAGSFFWQMEDAPRFKISFLSGDEPAWIGSTDGMKAASIEFIACIKRMTVSTQPYSH